MQQMVKCFETMYGKPLGSAESENVSHIWFLIPDVCYQHKLIVPLKVSLFAIIQL